MPGANDDHIVLFGKTRHLPQFLVAPFYQSIRPVPAHSTGRQFISIVTALAIFPVLSFADFEMLMSKRLLTIIVCLCCVMPASGQAGVCEGSPRTSEAQFLAGQHFESGAGIPRDLNKAVACYEAAAGRGHARAMLRLGMLYYNGDVLGDSFVADPRLAWMWFSLANVYGESTGAEEARRIEADFRPDVVEELRSRIGKQMLKGGMVPKDIAKALTLYSSFANHGSVNAAEELASLYTNGVYVPADTAMAIKWHEQAAALGSVDAMLSLARLAESGAKPDMSRAAEWYERAVRAGGARKSEALFALARSVEAAAPPDFARAMNLYKDAARLGDAPSMNRLGEMYASGLGTPVDLIMADAWFTVAAYFDSPAAKASAQELEPTLKPAQIDAAKLKAHELMAQVKPETALAQ